MRFATSYLLAGVSLFLLAMPCDAQRIEIRECQSNSTWQNCYGAITRRLEDAQYKSDPNKALALVENWNKMYRAAYLKLNKQGHSASDLAQFEDAVRDELDPLSRVKDKLSDEVIKKHFARLAPVMAFLASAPVRALITFLTPSNIATDLDELESSNKEIQTKLVAIVSPYLVPDWRSRVSKALETVSRSATIRRP